MANNITIKDATGTDVIMKTIETGGVHAAAQAGFDSTTGRVFTRTDGYDATTGKLFVRADSYDAVNNRTLTRTDGYDPVTGKLLVRTDGYDTGSSRILVRPDGYDTGTSRLLVRTDGYDVGSGKLLVSTTDIATKLSSTPDNQLAGNPVRVIGQDIWNCSFSSVGASVLASQLTTPVVGTGIGYSQAAGALAITTGTTVNAEFLTRSTVPWRSSMRQRVSIVASQRIANQNLAFILGDLVGEGLACTINSATSITVTKTAHGYTAQNIGQFMFVGAIVGAAGVPGRYAIASITDANNIVFTVAGWPASGSCTLTLFGHSHVKTLVTGVTATNVNWTTQRNGWADVDTVATINTTASPGVILQNELDGRQCYLSDTLRATNTTPNVTTRASRFENIPDDNLDLYLWIWNYNGTTAPASTTTWTISFLSVERFANTPVYIQGYRAQGSANPQTILVGGGTLPTVTTVGTVTTVTTVTTVASVTAANWGIPNSIADIASAALTSTTTTAAFTPTAGSSYSVAIPVTLVSGTTPTLDVGIEESMDGGTNWFRVYDFPRITATGIYYSPVMPLTGNRVRYVQTVSGTTPSFTRSLNRLQTNTNPAPVRQLIDRTIVVNTLNSTTVTFNTLDTGNNIKILLSLGAVTTTPPAIQLEGSDDGGLTWVASGSPLTGVASSTVALTVGPASWGQMRVRVSTAGVGATLNYVLIKCHD